MQSARLRKTIAFDVPCGKNFKSDTKKLSYNPKRDSENSNIQGSSKKKKKKGVGGRDKFRGRDSHVYRNL